MRERLSFEAWRGVSVRVRMGEKGMQGGRDVAKTDRQADRQNGKEDSAMMEEMP